MIPVCLTGIEAGIDGWVSVLKNYRDCLQNSLDTGQMTGVCDELHSFYLCDMFWKNVGPFMNNAIPYIANKIYTGGQQGAKGGGEYLTVKSAWDNAQGSINYFTQSYAANSLKLFQAKSIAEIGTEVCRAFISGKGPTSFKNLIEPDSPPQFSAWFSSEKYSDATVPATAQYKVFYHIFAGKSSGVQYQVYLKNPPESPYYATAQTVAVATGFVKQGAYASETKDFTAPEGYRELCIRINNEDKCGFGEVSTSYFVNSLADNYVSEQANATGITSARECISGTLGVAVSANPQALLEESIFPQNYNRGIVRICATRNPAESTEPLRYVEVGYCDDKNMKCWLDKTSVSNAISDSNRGALNHTLSSLEQMQKSILEKEGYALLTNDQADAALKKLADDEKKLVVTGTEKGNAILSEADSLEPKLFYTKHKAALLLVRAKVLGRVAWYQRIYNLIFGGATKPKTPAPTPAESTAKPKTIEILKSGEINWQFRWVSGTGAQIRKNIADSNWVSVKVYNEPGIDEPARSILIELKAKIKDASEASYQQFLEIIKANAADATKGGEGIEIVEDERWIYAVELRDMGIGMLKDYLSLAPSTSAITEKPTTCGNGKIDAGEFCDYVNGKAYINSVAGKIEGTKYAAGSYGGLRWAYGGTSTYLSFDDSKSCTYLATSDCDDSVYGHLEEGFCGDCMFYAPQISCDDPDKYGDKGRSEWYWAKLSLVNGKSHIDKSYYQYISSSKTYGTNPCINSALKITPKLV